MEPEKETNLDYGRRRLTDLSVEELSVRSKQLSRDLEGSEQKLLSFGNQDIGKSRTLEGISFSEKRFSKKKFGIGLVAMGAVASYFIFLEDANSSDFSQYNSSQTSYSISRTQTYKP